MSNLVLYSRLNSEVLRNTAYYVDIISPESGRQGGTYQAAPPPFLNNTVISQFGPEPLSSEKPHLTAHSFFLNSCYLNVI